MKKKTIKNEKKLAKIFTPKKQVCTYALISINIVIYLYMVLYDTEGSLLYALFNNYLLIQKGELYRLFTSMFVHGDIFHLAFNMYALYILGPQVERYYGRKRFLFIYILSGLLGSVFSSVFLSSSAYSIGASGAIFGLFGSIMYFTYYYRATLQSFLRGPIIPTLLINLAIGITIPGIDLSAHIGGLIGGVLTSMAIGIGDKGRKADQVNGAIVLVLMFIAMSYFIFIK
ncbi:MAG: rhomboid family intramembrane serine protease [Tenericutes bacterium]|nr:rhomboid family intramembrane serine protease [Mycoplasmatota bacterium]